MNVIWINTQTFSVMKLNKSEITVAISYNTLISTTEEALVFTAVYSSMHIYAITLLSN
jgi:hypothetical protein